MADLAHRAELERRIERAMSGLSSKERRELVALLGDPPDLANVPQSFWQDVYEDRIASLMGVLLLGFVVGARQHGAEDRSATAQAAQAYAERRAREVAQAFVERSQEALRAKGADWATRTSDPAKETPTKAEAREAAAEVFAPSRDENIGITETTSAGQAGSEWAVTQRGEASDEDRWRTERDARVCPICSPLESRPRSEWQAKFPTGPPAHPRCRCFIEYAVETQRVPLEIG
jgi:hypothetical protein